MTKDTSSASPPVGSGKEGGSGAGAASFDAQHTAPAASHAPGPWKAAAPDGSYHDVIRIFAEADPEGALPVAVCPQRQSAIMSVLAGQTNGTTEAACNARLIAAAPDLLAFVKKIATQLHADEQSERGRQVREALELHKRATEG